MKKCVILRLIFLLLLILSAVFMIYVNYNAAGFRLLDISASKGEWIVKSRIPSMILFAALLLVNLLMFAFKNRKKARNKP